MTKQDSNTEVESTTVAQLTPYGAHKLVNAALEKAGLDKRIPPQMMYNYTSGRIAKGKKPFIEFTPEAGVNAESLASWIETYVASQVLKAAGVEHEVVEGEHVDEDNDVQLTDQVESDVDA